MKTHLFLMVMLAIITTGKLSAQYIEITFSGDNNGEQVQLDSVLVRNINQHDHAMIYPPDLSLILLMVGMEENTVMQNPLFELSPNHPNPFRDQTSFEIMLPESALVDISITNILGQVMISRSEWLTAGNHSYIYSGNNHTTYLLTVSASGTRKTIKMLGTSAVGNINPGLEYSIHSTYNNNFKSTAMAGDLLFSPGDELMMVGYADTLESGCAESPESSHECMFQFATNIACPGNETVTYMGQTYNTIQIFGQCWLKENLNAGEMINSSIAPTNNGTIEKYCVGNQESYCNMLGGLYFWSEVMEYTNQNGTQGICPEGWHVPTDLDWRILEGAVDSEYTIDDSEWGFNSWRGTDAGGNLKQTGTTYWSYPNTGATDAYGFKALPAGYFVENAFWGIGYKTHWWSSDPAHFYMHHVDWEHAEIKRQSGGDEAAISVRCIKD